VVEFLRGIATGSKGDVGVRGLRLWSDTPVGCKNILKQASKTAEVLVEGMLRLGAFVEVGWW
jgi:hypothetical protein